MPALRFRHVFVDVALLLQTLPFFPPRQVLKPYVSSGSVRTHGRLPRHVYESSSSARPSTHVCPGPRSIASFCSFLFFVLRDLPCTSASVAQSGLVFVTSVAVMLSSVLTLGWICCWMSLSRGWQPLHACMTQCQSISLYCYSPYRAHHAVMSAFVSRRTVHLCRGVVCNCSYARTCGMFSK
jgi:hypothetical protein